MSETTVEISRKIENLPTDLQREVEDSVDFLQERRNARGQRTLKLPWAGALKEYKDKYTSLELEQKALEWRGD